MNISDDVMAALLASRDDKIPDHVLADLSWSDAYIIQARILRMYGETVGGWKIALGPGAIPIAAPLFASTVLKTSAELKLHVERPYKIEVELGFVLNKDIPPRVEPYDRNDIVAAIGSVHAAIEVVGPRAGEPGQVPFGAFLADNLGNAFTIFADGVSLVEPLATTGQLLGDGEVIAEGGHPHHDPLTPLLLYANKPGDTLGGLRAGQLIITGSYTGARLVYLAGQYEGRFAELPSVHVSFNT
jgi:2-keto-4-pentenoate hydratase